MLSVIWRESLSNYIQANEAAIPFNALCHIDLDRRPFIEPWIKQWGLENWLNQVLQVSILPRLFLETEIRVQAALNPLFVFRQGVKVSC